MPLIVTIISIVLSGIYIFSTVEVIDLSTILLGLFSSITQGILLAGTTICGVVMKDLKSFNKEDPQ